MPGEQNETMSLARQLGHVTSKQDDNGRGELAQGLSHS